MTVKLRSGVLRGGYIPLFLSHMHAFLYQNIFLEYWVKDLCFVSAPPVTTSAAMTVSEKEKQRRAENRMWLISSVLGGIAFISSCLLCICCIWRKCSLLTSEGKL